jgi:hypothetical protein
MGATVTEDERRTALIESLPRKYQPVTDMIFFNNALSYEEIVTGLRQVEAKRERESRASEQSVNGAESAHVANAGRFAKYTCRKCGRMVL